MKHLKTTKGQAEWEGKRLFFYFWREYVKTNNQVNVAWIVRYTSKKYSDIDILLLLQETLKQED